MTLIIKNGTIVTDTSSFEGDILVEGEKIVQVGSYLTQPVGAQIVEASGKLVLPGGVDAHTHFGLPMSGIVSSDDHYTGHKAAAFGGTTTAIDFVPHGPGSLSANIDAWHASADAKAAIDFSFHMNISRLDPEVAGQIPELSKDGITSVKVFMAYPNLRMNDGDIFKVMRIARQAGMLTMLHAEGGDVIDILVAEALADGHTSAEWHGLTRPAWGAVEATLRGAMLAAQADAPLYVVHMNTAGEVDLLQYARQQGLKVMGETCLQYLFFTQDDLGRPDGAKWVCSPPVRGKADNARLWQGLEQGILQTFATDHCPFFFDGTQPIMYEGKPVALPGKELGKDNFTKIPNGLPGVADRLPILWTFGVGAGRITPNQFVALTAANPAKIFGLYPRKGSLTPGADADIAIWDPTRRLTYGTAYSHHRTDYNLYEGWELQGYPEKVFLRGNLIVDGENWAGRAGMGQYLFRNSNNPVL
jgi:dihydropyrimidinase